MLTSRLVDGGDHPIAGADERAGALDDLALHGVHVEARDDAQDGRAEAGDAFARRLAPAAGLVVSVHRSPLLWVCRKIDSARRDPEPPNPAKDMKRIQYSPNRAHP